MRRWLIALTLVSLALASVVAMRLAAVEPKPTPIVPSDILLGGIDVLTVQELLKAEHQLEQARISGDFAAYRRLTSDRMFTSTHNNEAVSGRACDQTTFKPRPKREPTAGFEEGTLLAAVRVGDTAALFYAVTKEWPKLGFQGYPITCKRFVLRNGAWVCDIQVLTYHDVIPKTAEEWLAIDGGGTWRVDGVIHPAEPLLPPAAYPGKVALNSDALTTVKINGQLVAETNLAHFERSSSTWSVLNTLQAGLHQGDNTIEIVSEPRENNATTQPDTTPPPFGANVEVHHFGPSRKLVEIYKKKIEPGQSVSISEKFILQNPDVPAQPVRCETCGQ